MNPENGYDRSTDLQSTFTIESRHPMIMECAENVTGACAGDREKLVRLFYFVRDSIRYNLFMISAFEEDFKASRALEWGKGYCVQKAVLLAALARAAGIPSRLAFAKIRNHRTPEHIETRWARTYLPDTATTNSTTTANGSVPSLPSTGICVPATACRRWSSTAQGMRIFRRRTCRDDRTSSISKNTRPRPTSLSSGSSR